MTAAPSSAIPRALRWVGLGLAIATMLVGGLNLVVAPWGLAETRTHLGFQMLSCFGNNGYLVDGFHPLVQHYLAGGQAIALFAYSAVFAVTAGVRARWARWTCFAAQVVVTAMMALTVWGYAGSVPTIEFWLAGLAALAGTAAVALAVRAHWLHDAIAVVMLLFLAGLHLWSVAMASTLPDFDPRLPGDAGVRLIFLAWTPALFFALAAVGAVLAAIGAVGHPATASPTLRPARPAGAPRASARR